MDRDRYGDISIRDAGEGRHPEDVLERHRRVDRALVAALAEMYAAGTGTRKVQRMAEKMGIERLGRDLCFVKRI